MRKYSVRLAPVAILPGEVAARLNLRPLPRIGDRLSTLIYDAFVSGRQIGPVAVSGPGTAGAGVGVVPEVVASLAHDDSNIEPQVEGAGSGRQSSIGKVTEQDLQYFVKGCQRLKFGPRNQQMVLPRRSFTELVEGCAEPVRGSGDWWQRLAR
jgi:hypothetical protein